MKQLTKEQQEQAVELIEKISTMPCHASYANNTNYVQSAKTFLQSLKPKIYIGCIDHSDMVFLENKEDEYWCSDIDKAINFDSFDEARAVLESIKKYKAFRYFILTE